MELYNDSARRAQRYGRLISTADACFYWAHGLSLV